MFATFRIETQKVSKFGRIEKAYRNKDGIYPGIPVGVVGAAWGTNIGMFVYSLIGLIYFARGKASFYTHAFSFRMEKKLSLEIIKLGIPSLLMSIMSLVQSIVIFNALAKYGTASDIAFYGVVNRVFSFLLTPIMGLMRALQPVLGINFGAKQYERTIRTYKTFSYAAMIITVPFWLIAILMPEQILGLMLTESVLTTAQITAFRTYMSLLPLLSFVMMGMTFFPAVKKPAPAGVLGMARQFVFYVPAMLIVPRLFGVNGVYYASFAIDLIITAWCMIWVKKEFKNIRNLHEETKL